MSIVPVEAIRTSHRSDLNLHRKKIKHEENDLRRSLDSMSLSDVDLLELANKLKNKSTTSVSDLQLLKNILLESEKNITQVLNTQGALRGLVREITGSDENRQVEAAGCLCNLALADPRGCLAVIKAAGVYLVAALDSQNLQLAVTCAWTLGNLSGSGVAAARDLASLGAASRLCAMAAGDRERTDAAVYALTHYVHSMGDELSEEHLNLIMKSVSEVDCPGWFRLISLTSSHSTFNDPSDHLQNRIIQEFPHLMHHHLNRCTGVDCCELQSAIRVLANLDLGPGYLPLLQHIHSQPDWRTDFVQLVKLQGEAISAASYRQAACGTYVSVSGGRAVKQEVSDRAARAARRRARHHLHRKKQ